MSIEQVRKVLDRRYGTHGLTDTINQQTAAEIHALYASERGGDDVKEDLKNAIADWRGGSSYPCDLAAAILRAIDARVGAKGETSDADRVARRFLTSVSALLTELVPDWCDGDLEVDAKDAIRALAEAKAQAEMDAKRAADNLLAVQGLLHQAITASAQVGP